jgi:hypothetical protein
MFKISFLLLISTMTFVTMKNINSNNGDNVGGDIYSKSGFVSLFQSISKSIAPPKTPLVVYFKGGRLILQEISGKLEGKIHWDQKKNEFDYDVRHSFIG